MDAPGVQNTKAEDEKARYLKRVALKDLNLTPFQQESSKLDSSLKRHTAIIKRMRQSIGVENREQIMKDIESLSLEKYIDELASAALEGVGRCKTERDAWSAVEIVSALHRRFKQTFTPAFTTGLLSTLAPPPRGMPADQREREDAGRVLRQRPALRVCAELALVGIGVPAEGVMRVIKDLLSNDPTLSSLPLLSTFLRSYARPFLGIGMSLEEEDGLVDKEVRDRFKRMIESYFDTVCKKLVIEHKRLQEQDRRNHEAYIRSGEIFEDRQQAYEKMTKNYEKLASNCQILSELLSIPLPSLPTSSSKTDSIQINVGGSAGEGADEGIAVTSGGKWEDEEERKFYEDIQDLKDFVPRSVLGLEEGDERRAADDDQREREQKAREEEEIKQVEEELEGLKLKEGDDGDKADVQVEEMLEPVDGVEGDDDDVPTPTPGSPKPASPPLSPALAPQGPSQLLTALLARLPDATNRELIDQAAVDFSFLNSKAARKRLVRFLGQVPKNRVDLIPYYSRLVATLNKYLPDVGTELVSILDEEFRYLQRKKNVVNQFTEMRLKNMTYLAHLTKFRVVPTHVILHMFKVCLDDFSGTNVDNIALLLEGCGRFLLRSEDTKERFAKMLELMRRKQSLQHFDQRQILLLENAYYQCNPPERAPRTFKERTPMELFIHHLIYDVLSKKTIDKVLKLLRKLDWGDSMVRRTLHKVFTKPWKIKYGSISLLAMLTYDLQRYHPGFAITIVDQVLEDFRRGLDVNLYSTNQRRLATMKYLGELYIYRLFSSSIIFDTLWTLVTFGHVDGRPLPRQPCPLDMPDDFFRIRLVCVLLDTCGMCFDKGTQRKKLDDFFTFFQYYVRCKEELPMEVEFMLSDSLEESFLTAVRPKLTMYTTTEEAAVAVDEMFNAAFQNMNVANGTSYDDSDGEEEEERPSEEPEDGEDSESTPGTPHGSRAPSPDPVVVLSAQEHLGPSEEAEAEFAKELAKMVTETSVDVRKVDKKATLELLESTILPSHHLLHKRRAENDEEEGERVQEHDSSVMNFSVITKRGNKQQIRQIAVPAVSPIAVHTRSAQLQDKVEQQQLKQLVLNYEQREEAEEKRAFDMRNRAGGIKIRYAS